MPGEAGPIATAVCVAGVSRPRPFCRSRGSGCGRTRARGTRERPAASSPSRMDDPASKHGGRVHAIAPAATRFIKPKRRGPFDGDPAPNGKNNQLRSAPAGTCDDLTNRRPGRPQSATRPRGMVADQPVRPTAVQARKATSPARQAGRKQWRLCQSLHRLPRCGGCQDRLSERDDQPQPAAVDHVRRCERNFDGAEFTAW